MEDAERLWPKPKGTITRQKEAEPHEQRCGGGKDERHPVITGPPSSPRGPPRRVARGWMGGKEGVVEGTQQRGELPNSPGVGGTVQGLWFRERRLAARGSAPSREHPCTCCFLRRGLTQPYEGHSPSFHRWGNRGSGTLSLLPKVTEQTGSHPLLSCDPGTDPKLTLRAGCGQQSWGDASPSYTESPHSPLETPQEGVGRGSAGQVTSAGPRMKGGSPGSAFAFGMQTVPTAQYRL